MFKFKSFFESSITSSATLTLSFLNLNDSLRKIKALKKKISKKILNCGQCLPKVTYRVGFFNSLR